MTEALDLVLAGGRLEELANAPIKPARARSPSPGRVRLQGRYAGVARTETHEIDLDVDLDVEVDQDTMKAAVAQIAVNGAIGDAVRPAAALADGEPKPTSPTEALELLLGESEHFGPAKVDSLETELEKQQNRIRELENFLKSAEGENEQLRQARDTLQEELDKRPLVRTTEPESPRTDEPFRARMNSPGSGSSLEKLADDDDDKRHFVDEQSSLRAENSELQKMVRKLHNDLEAAHAQTRRDREALLDLQALAEDAQRNSADPAVLAELNLAREDLAQERDARRQLEESLSAAVAEHNAKREELERNVAELEIAKRREKEENVAFCAKFDEEAARRDEEVASLKNRMQLAQDDTKHFQALLEDSEKTLGTSQGELAAAKAELGALRDVVKSTGAANEDTTAQLAEVRGELARERQARVAAVESERARTASVEAELTESRATFDAQIKTTERKAAAAMKTAQTDRGYLQAAREQRDEADRFAADLRVEKDGLERTAADLREQLKILRETVRQQKETIDQIRTPRIAPRVAAPVTKTVTSPKASVANPISGVVTAQRMDKDADACAVEQVYVPPMIATKGEASPTKSVSSQAEASGPAGASASVPAGANRPGPILVNSMGSPKRMVDGHMSPNPVGRLQAQPRGAGFTTPGPAPTPGYPPASMGNSMGFPGRPGPPPQTQVAMPSHQPYRRANTVPQGVPQQPNFFGGMDGRVNIQVSGMRRVR